MSVGEWAAVTAAGAAVVFVVTVAVVAKAVMQTLREVNATVVDARRTIANIDPLITDVRSMATGVETVLKTPGVKAAAVASGIGRGVAHLKDKLH